MVWVDEDHAPLVHDKRFSRREQREALDYRKQHGISIQRHPTRQNAQCWSIRRRRYRIQKAHVNRCIIIRGWNDNFLRHAGQRDGQRILDRKRWVEILRAFHLRAANRKPFRVYEVQLREERHPPHRLCEICCIDGVQLADQGQIIGSGPNERTPTLYEIGDTFPSLNGGLRHPIGQHFFRRCLGQQPISFQYDQAGNRSQQQEDGYMSCRHGSPVRSCHETPRLMPDLSPSPADTFRNRTCDPTFDDRGQQRGCEQRQGKIQTIEGISAAVGEILDASQKAIDGSTYQP